MPLTHLLYRKTSNNIKLTATATALAMTTRVMTILLLPTIRLKGLPSNSPTIKTTLITLNVEPRVIKNQKHPMKPTTIHSPTRLRPQLTTIEPNLFFLDINPTVQRGP